MSKTRTRIADDYKLAKALVTITAAASIYLEDGQRSIWIYLVNRKLHFHGEQEKGMCKRLVGHYRCRKILDGLTGKVMWQLQNRLLRLYIKEDD